jgi:hypothetical protein
MAAAVTALVLPVNFSWSGPFPLVVKGTTTSWLTVLGTSSLSSSPLSHSPSESMIKTMFQTNRNNCFADIRTSSIVWVGSLVSSITPSRRNFMATCHNTQHQKHIHLIARLRSFAQQAEITRVQLPHPLFGTSRRLAQQIKNTTTSSVCLFAHKFQTSERTGNHLILPLPFSWT